MRQRVACYVTRSAQDGEELLVFDHANDEGAEPSGTQIPAGGMLDFEDIADAAVRETEEETGLTGTTFVEQVGLVQLGRDEVGGPSLTTYVHLTTSSDGGRAWQHTVGGGGEDGGMVFLCRWEPLPLEFELAGGQGQFIDAVLGRLDARD